MKEDYYIEAALNLNLIDGDGITINDSNTMITKNDITIEVNDTIINRAIYLEKLSSIRETRDILLAGTDWMALPDTNMELKESLLAYRQLLRDCPSTLIEGSEDSFDYPQDPRFERSNS